jgi:RNA polymerase sigma factor (sigma-70 family)
VRSPGLSFEECYREQLLAMVRLAHVVTGSNAVAEDLVHDAFVKLRSVFDEVRDPVPYLRAMVLNECRMWFRRRQVERRHSQASTEQLVLPPELDTVWQHLFTISPRRRAVLYLRFYEDMSVDDIAALLRCRPSTVRSLLRRGLASMAEVINRE